jgi:hypothetical protein
MTEYGAMLLADRSGRKLSASQRETAVQFALSRAEELWRKYGHANLSQLASELGVAVQLVDTPRVEAGLEVYSEYVTAARGMPPTIRIYAGCPRACALAHELLHHLESMHGWTGVLFIRAQHLGWMWKIRRLRVLSEIAALRFAELATGAAQ